jgi:hypothetical protein
VEVFAMPKSKGPLTVVAANDLGDGVDAVDALTCATLAQASMAFKSYVPAAIVVAGPFLETSPDPAASTILRFEIIHNDSICRIPLADACVHICAQHHAARFVATDAYNYVSYWHRESRPTPANSGWAPLSIGQRSHSHEVLILGQTLPSAIAPEGGAGYLHYVPKRKGDGWSVRVGLATDGTDPDTEMGFHVAVTARPAWNTPLQAVPLI